MLPDGTQLGNPNDEPRQTAPTDEHAAQ
jgi:hypothetical protein